MKRREPACLMRTLTQSNCPGPQGVDMKTLFQSALVDVCFEITWKKDGIHHSDRYFADHLNGWRDIFPGSPLEILSGQDLSQPIILRINPMGLVTEYFIQSGCFDEISTISSRGFPRPHDDTYFPQLRLSDPIYAVIGRTLAK